MSPAIDRAASASRGRIIDGLFVVTSGLADGEPVLLSAGLGGLGEFWRPQLAALEARHRVILYDHRGTGRSDRAPLPTPYGVERLADDLRIVLDGLDIERAHIVGHAAGGVAGLELARLAPDRLRSLVVVNGWIGPDPHFARCMDIRSEILRVSGPAAYLAAQPLFLYPAEWISDHLEALDAQSDAHLDTFQSPKTLAARMTALKGFDRRLLLRGITTPVLVMAAADDMLVPARAGRQLANDIPNARFIEMPRGGHAVNVTQSEIFNRHLLDYLARQTSEHQ